jgi:hypothetical protein
MRHPGLLQAPDQALQQLTPSSADLIVAVAGCAAGAPAVVSHAAADALDCMLGAVHVPSALAVLVDALAAAVDQGMATAVGGHDGAIAPAGSSGAHLLLRSLCAGVQRAVARLSGPATAAAGAQALPADLVPLLRTCADSEALEVRVAAVWPSSCCEASCSAFFVASNSGMRRADKWDWACGCVLNAGTQSSGVRFGPNSPHSW